MLLYPTIVYQSQLSSFSSLIAPVVISRLLRQYYCCCCRLTSNCQVLLNSRSPLSSHCSLQLFASHRLGVVVNCLLSIASRSPLNCVNRCDSHGSSINEWRLDLGVERRTTVSVVTSSNPPLSLSEELGHACTWWRRDGNGCYGNEIGARFDLDVKLGVKISYIPSILGRIQKAKLCLPSLSLLFSVVCEFAIGLSFVLRTLTVTSTVEKLRKKQPLK